ncbi:MAG TPA: histidine triad (HIT) protein [Micromonosporaceae bacterium]|nr:histidine triad (HIT) protein [Micromonosporaceae bacterium]
MTVADAPGTGCPICAKHRGEGPLVGPVIWRDELLVVTHRRVGEDGTVILGYLFVETLRHVAYLDGLTDDEAGAVGRAVRRAARGLRAELAPEFVFSAVIGTGVPHFHQHVFPRYPDTPEEYDWAASAQWPGAPHGGPAELADLCARLRSYLAPAGRP